MIEKLTVSRAAKALLSALALLGAALTAAPAHASSVPSEFAVRGILTPDRPLGPRDYVWEPAGVPAGPTRVVVDLTAKMLYVYRGGIEIGRTYIIYGKDEKPTPTGIFPILQKKRHHVSNIYGAPMPYMMRLTWDGIAIHESSVEADAATHGCIGIPQEFAAELFREAKLGDKVLVTRGWMRAAYGR